MRYDKEQIRKAMQLYAVTDRAWLAGNTLSEVTEKALQGGTTMVQLREKDLDSETFLQEAKELQRLCQKYKVPFVVNDNVDIALQMNADGVHIGQSDMELQNARQRLGKDKLIGVSAQTVEHALRAQEQGADYLGVGAVFPTGSKADAEDVSLVMLQEICNAVTIPVVAIGGISIHNVQKLYGSGIDGIAVISAIFAQSDIREAAEELKHLTNIFQKRC